MEAAVIVRDLAKRFGSFTAVDRISLEVGQGEIFGFLGPNGAGKSTTIRMLCGILKPTSGNGSVSGFDIIRQPELIKSRIGYMSQKFSLYEDLTVEENIDFYSGIYRIPDSRKTQRKEWAISMAGLSEHRHSKTGTLSGGWKQRLSLGCAILHEPRVLFLDEPTSGVDPLSRRSFWDLIYAMAGEGVTVFVTTHYMDEAEYCDRLALIYRGRLVASGTPEELKSGYMTEDILEIQTDRPQDAMEDLRKIAGIREVALFGRTLHAVVESADHVIPEIHSVFQRSGFNPPKIRSIRPSLEDVFVSLIEARDRQEADFEVKR